MGKNFIGTYISGGVVMATLVTVGFLSIPEKNPEPVVTPYAIQEIRRDPVVAIPLTMTWPAAESEITSGFGPRDTSGCWACDSFHTGLDFGGAWGVPIVASVAGTVVTVGWHQYLGYRIVISDGVRTYIYGHLTAWSSPANVVPGAYVNMGDIIGLMGSTGNSTGPHLHFQIEENGTAIDPYPILKEQTIQRYK